MSESTDESTPVVGALLAEPDGEQLEHGDSQEDSLEPEPDPAFDPLTRGLHWLMAVLIVAMLFLGAAMVGTIGDYGVLLSIHRTVGLAILALALVRMANRVLRRAPASHARLSRGERWAAFASELTLYVLFTLQPLLGWALVSASGIPVRVAGEVRLPAIAPENARLYAELHLVHTWLAYALLALFTAHMCAVLWHAVVLRDGLLRRMLPASRLRRERRSS
ncbi:cytochrome b [Nocardia concava]|uniref:cytochrome b n=1 Tax=Nocardia concava TaxID=257281 RepID=UPI0002E47F71|nr:cytochrome b [Nocardia concava]